SPFQGRASGRDQQRPTPAPPPAAPGPAGDDGGGTTPGGLTRRVRGAQLPTASPLAIRRAGGAPSGGQGGAPPAPAAPAAPTGTPERIPEQRRSADAVYSFLSSFTAGVQRGLDDTGTREQPPQ